MGLKAKLKTKSEEEKNEELEAEKKEVLEGAIARGKETEQEPDAESTEDTEVNDEEEYNSSQLTFEEELAIQERQRKEEETGANTDRLRIATSLVSRLFNLDNSYSVSKFDDKGKVMNLTMENREFAINIQIKDSGRHGLTVYED